VYSPIKNHSSQARGDALIIFVAALSRVLKNKHQAVSQGVRRFGKRSVSIAM